MFEANEANSLMLKARSSKLDNWEKLQNEIRWRAYNGYDSFYLTNMDYLALFTMLEDYGYSIAYDKERNSWYCTWA